VHGGKCVELFGTRVNGLNRGWYNTFTKRGGGWEEDSAGNLDRQLSLKRGNGEGAAGAKVRRRNDFKE